MIPIPGLGFSTHRDSLGLLKSKLASGGCWVFHPAGMGVAKRVTVRRPVGLYGICQLPEAAEILGFPQLWAKDIDWD